MVLGDTQKIEDRNLLRFLGEGRGIEQTGVEERSREWERATSLGDGLDCAETRLGKARGTEAGGPSAGAEAPRAL